MLLNFMGQKKILPFFFLGFFLAQYLGLGTMAITVFGTIIAFIIYLFGENKDKEVA
jgi:PTS system mannose-specific IID component